MSAELNRISRSGKTIKTIQQQKQFFNVTESIGYDPLSQKHFLSREEKIKIIQTVAFQTGYQLPNWVRNQQ